MLKKVGIIGHFAHGRDFFDGQTIKIRTLTQALQNELGQAEIRTLDTCGGLKNIVSIVFGTFKMLVKCKNIIMLPANNGLKVFVPLLSLGNLIFKRKLHYSVIGGWLPEFVKEHKIIKKLLQKFDCIYAETNAMKIALEAMGFSNVHIVPNFKNIDILSEDELVYNHSKPFKLCTFSRVMKEKGIEDAIDAVKAINMQAGEVVCALDIYGKIDSDYENRFAKLQADFPEYIRYCGCIDANDSVNVLKNYYTLLFPTHFKTEGIPGTIVDALCSGVPTISREWNSANEVVISGKTGVVYPNERHSNLSEALDFFIQNENVICAMKRNCLCFAKEFSLECALGILMSNLM